MDIIMHFKKKRNLFLSVLLYVSILAPAAGGLAFHAHADDSAPDTDSRQTEADTEDSRQGIADANSSSEGLYHENKWNFVEDSMDISGGIPDDVVGRLSRIRENKKLVVCTEPYFAPQEFIDPELSGQDQYQGADMELARLIADRMGVELEIVPLEFTDVLTSIGQGKYDLAISGLSYTPGRASTMELSKGYHFSSEGAQVGMIIREEDASGLSELSDLTGKNIAAQAGSLQELLVAQNITDYHQFIRLGSIQDVYDEVREGRADAAGVDIENAKVYIRNNPDCGLVLMENIAFVLDEQFEGDRIAGPKDDLELMYFVNAVIDEVLASGQYETWFNEASERAAELGL